MKKVLFFIILVFTSFIFIGCNSSGSFEFSSQMIKNNLSEREIETDPKYNIVYSDLSNYIVTKKYLPSGLVIVFDSETRQSCWSLLTGKLLFEPNEHIRIQVIERTYMSYVMTTDMLTKKVTLYDALGNVVLPSGDYISVNADIITGYSLIGSFDIEDYIEKVVYTLIEDGTIVYYKKYNKIDLSNGTREETIFQQNEDYNSLMKADLKPYGLDGYYWILVSNTYYIYKDNGKLINKIYIPNFDSFNIVNGKLIYQIVYKVDKDAEDYTYISENYKYKIDTTQVDILTGKIKTLELNYLIRYSQIYYDKFNKPTYAYARVQNVLEKKLEDFYDTDIIIDKNGKILYNLEINPLNLQKLDDNHFYSDQNKFIYNDKLEPIFAILGKTSVAEEEGLLITFYDGYYGAINAEGNIVIPFEYTFMESSFINGRTYAKHMNGTYYIINKDGSLIPLGGKVISPVRGLLFSYTYNEITKIYRANLLDYDNKELGAYEYIAQEAPNFIFDNARTGSFKVCEFEKSSGKFFYVLIDDLTK